MSDDNRIDEEWRGDVCDRADPMPVTHSTEQFRGHVWNVRTDTVSFPDGSLVARDVIEHPGAVGIAALDEEDRILLIRQYRHPVGAFLFELPAGLRDIAGESPLDTAKRELAEEAGIAAAQWSILVDYFNSPGGSSEANRCYLARGLTVIPGGRCPSGEAEEAHLPRAWLPLDQAVELVLAGALHNPATVTGVLAAAAARDRGWATVRPADGPMWTV
jgi:8-oxo-dGDP phosphatase